MNWYDTDNFKQQKHWWHNPRISAFEHLKVNAYAKGILYVMCSNLKINKHQIYKMFI